MEQQETQPEVLTDAALALHRWRYKQARLKGFSWWEAKQFAHSRIDIADMRELAENGCDPELILRILL